MKKIILSVSLSFISFSLFSQDTIRLRHTNFETVFSKSKKYPVLVEWWLTRSKISCPNPLPRKDLFLPDPLLLEHTNLSDDYKKSGFDRGHMAPAADNQCLTSKVQEECFYFSNMSPQLGSLNRGDWKSLEAWTRDLSKENDSVRVWCGNIGEIKKIGRVSVPEYCWKVVYIKKTNKFHCFWFKNDLSKADGIKNNEISLSEMKKLTGFLFN